MLLVFKFKLSRKIQIKLKIIWYRNVACIRLYLCINEDICDQVAARAEVNQLNFKQVDHKLSTLEVLTNKQKPLEVQK